MILLVRVSLRCCPRSGAGRSGSLLLALALHLLPRSSLQNAPGRNYQSTVTRTNGECESTPLCRNIESAKHVTSHETSLILDRSREKPWLLVLGSIMDIPAGTYGEIDPGLPGGHCHRCSASPMRI